MKGMDMAMMARASTNALSGVAKKKKKGARSKAKKRAKHAKKAGSVDSAAPAGSYT
jgi:hypothetical protein